MQTRAKSQEQLDLTLIKPAKLAQLRNLRDLRSFHNLESEFAQNYR